MEERLKYCQTPFRFIQSCLFIDGRGYSGHTLSAVSSSPQVVITGAVCFVHVLCAKALSERVSKMAATAIMLRLILLFIVFVLDAWELIVLFFAKSGVRSKSEATVRTDGKDEGTGHIAIREADASIEVELAFFCMIEAQAIHYA